MNDKVKIALIGAVTVLAAVWGTNYYSPYRTCVRAATAEILEADQDSKAGPEAGALAAMDAAAGYDPDSPDATDHVGEFREPPAPQFMSEDEAERKAQLRCAST